MRRDGQTFVDLPVRQISPSRCPVRRSAWAMTVRIATNYNSAAGTIAPRVHWLPDTVIFWRDIMKNLAIYLAAGASTLLMTAASAAPLSPNASVAPESNIQNVRMVCNEDGRCWRERSERRVIVRESVTHTDMRRASVISSGAAMRNVAADRHPRPGVASNRYLLRKRQRRHEKKPRRNPRLF